MKHRLPVILWLPLIFVFYLSVTANAGQLEIIDHRTEQEGLFNNTVNAVSPAGDTGVFIASAGGLHILLDDFFLPIFQNIPATALSQDPGGDLWAATNAGLLYRITDRDGVWTAARFPFDKKKKITAIAARHNAVTIGTDSGLYSVNPDGSVHMIMKVAAVRALAVLSDGTIIAGVRDRTHKKGGLMIIGGAFAAKTEWVDELSGSTVTAFFADGDRLLIGTDDDGAFVLDATGVHGIELPEKPGRITALLADGSTTLVASDTGLYASVKDEPYESLSAGEGKGPAAVTSLAAGPGAMVWVGTQKDGLYLVRVRP
jgi:ligand-binding sensor domain-containing protein